jgi:sialate O-acetylesterase
MVLQRSMPVHLWGWDMAGQSVNVEFRGETKSTTADETGYWEVYLSPGSAGGPFAVTVRGSSTVKLSDVLVGDVWVASGQSNMEMPLDGFGPEAPIKDSENEIAEANYPEIRFITMAKTLSDYPLKDIHAALPWQVCSPQNAGTLSAAAYFFARDLQAVEKVPIGLIVSNWGGTWAESWTSMRTLTSDPVLLPLLASWERDIRDRADELRRIEKEDVEATKSGKPAPFHFTTYALEPAGLFNAMIAPLTPLRIKGVIWYQGESDATQGIDALYSRLFPAMIADWREAWGEGNFPFLYVQISAFGPPNANPWSVVREAQRRTLSIANTAMIVSADVGDPKNVHPPDKQTIGARLALAARAIGYGDPIEYSGPTFQQVSLEPGAIRAWFDHATGLNAHGELAGFEVAGSDQMFSPASAQIEGTTVVARNPAVPRPVYLRYAWAASPTITLFNQEGLPASPFNSAGAYADQDQPTK